LLRKLADQIKSSCDLQLFHFGSFSVFDRNSHRGIYFLAVCTLTVMAYIDCSCGSLVSRVFLKRQASHCIAFSKKYFRFANTSVLRITSSPSRLQHACRVGQAAGASGRKNQWKDFSILHHFFKRKDQIPQNQSSRRIRIREPCSNPCLLCEMPLLKPVIQLLWRRRQRRPSKQRKSRLRHLPAHHFPLVLKTPKLEKMLP